MELAKTPWEKYTEATDAAVRALGAGAITLDEYLSALDQLAQNLQQAEKGKGDAGRPAALRYGTVEAYSASLGGVSTNDKIADNTAATAKATQGADAKLAELNTRLAQSSWSFITVEP